MIYKATFRDNVGLFGFLGSFSLLSLWIGFRANQFTFFAVGVFIAFFILALRIRFYVSCADKMLEARSIVQVRRIPWDQIIEVTRAAEAGYWSSRFYGPSTYRFRTSVDHLTINFKFYSRDCFCEVMGRIKAQQGMHE